MILLHGFDRGYISKTTTPNGEIIDEIRGEIIHCRIILSDPADLQEFLSRHRTIRSPDVSHKNFREVKWAEYTTIPRKEYKAMCSK